MRTLTAGLGDPDVAADLFGHAPLALSFRRKCWGHVFVTSFLNIGGVQSVQRLRADDRRNIARDDPDLHHADLGGADGVAAARRTADRAPAGWRSILCIVGIAMLVYPLALKGVPLGLLLALATGVSWAAGTVYVKWMRLAARSVGVRHSGRWRWRSSSSPQASLWSMAGSISITHTRSCCSPPFSRGIVGSGIAYALWFAIVRRLSAATASLGALGNPAVGLSPPC